MKIPTSLRMNPFYMWLFLTLLGLFFLAFAIVTKSSANYDNVMPAFGTFTSTLIPGTRTRTPFPTVPTLPYGTYTPTPIPPTKTPTKTATKTPTRTPTRTKTPTNTATKTLTPSYTPYPAYYMGTGYFPTNILTRCHLGTKYFTETMNASSLWDSYTDISMTYSCLNPMITTNYMSVGNTGWAGYAFICNINNDCDNSTALNDTYKSCDVSLNAFYIEGDPVFYTPAEVQKLTMHELGHCYSLAHNPDPTSVMGNGASPNNQDIFLINARY
jgi:hypothetical protein